MEAQTESKLEAGDALLLVDVQNDFCSRGALPVPNGELVVPPLNQWIARAVDAGVPVLASRDWHPLGHPSFDREGGPWPTHCVQDTPGAAFHPDLRLPPDATVISKGTRFDMEQYSAFEETGLVAHLRSRGVERLFIGGLAREVCVRATVLDALAEGFQVHVIVQGTGALSEEEGARALGEMTAAGAVLETG